MEYVELGNTGLKVSRLCFGGLIIGPLQANLEVDKGAEVIRKALELGVNFIDTAELYGTYTYIREAVKHSKVKPIIATKSYAYSAQDAQKSLEKARKELDMDVIDIFLMHEQETRLTLRGHKEALEYYITAREKGLIRAVGVSTHNVEVVEAVAEMDGIDVIHPLVNRTGIGIGDGTITDMLTAVKRAFDLGKGIYSMKPLGGGNLIGSFEESMEFVLGLPFVHSIAVGMQSVEEVIMNVAIFEKGEVSEELRKSLKIKKRKLHIDFWCEGCGKCVNRCTHKALEIKDGKASVKNGQCILCGYCGSVCPVFAIKIF
ncbi:MAG: aldo/keto reductase [Acetivibrionales bacterium]|jgi:aryl-alcohol dehydrogenase-like predicted oxidoreductase